MNIQPTGARVLIKLLPKEEPKPHASGLILPESSGKAKYLKAEVLECGPGLRAVDGTLIPSEYKPGDKVLLCRLQSVEVEKDVHLLDSSELLAKYCD